MQVGQDSEATLAAWPAGKPPPEAAFGEVARYLAAQGVSPSQAAQLHAVPLVPVAAGARLLPPSRLFGRLPRDFSPFAYEVPLPQTPDICSGGNGVRAACCRFAHQVNHAVV